MENGTKNRFSTLKKDGTEEFSTGILDLTQAFVLEDR